ncbi:MAG: T9SS type A sorting domain-containing protein [Ignavibacteria bacterium]|nr:T9SS type A sorting domain-containing protein [Ignavibacteria bacterium]
MKYPNPFSSSTIILRNISTAGYVTINLYGLLGREVCGYEEGIKNIGVSMKKIDLSFLNSGVCFMKSELIEGDRHSADLGF